MSDAQSSKDLLQHVENWAAGAAHALGRLSDDEQKALGTIRAMLTAEPPYQSLRLRELADKWIADARNNGNGHKETCAHELIELLGSAQPPSAVQR